MQRQQPVHDKRRLQQRRLRRHAGGRLRPVPERERLPDPGESVSAGDVCQQRLRRREQVERDGMQRQQPVHDERRLQQRGLRRNAGRLPGWHDLRERDLCVQREQRVYGLLPEQHLRSAAESKRLW